MMVGNAERSRRFSGALKQRTSRRGIVLIAVLWIVMALSIIVTGVTRSVRDEARMLGTSRQSVQASATGDAAIQIALQELAAQPQPLDGLVNTTVQYRGSVIAVEVMPLNGLIDLNGAQLPLLTKLFTVAGQLPVDGAEQLAQAVVEYRSQPAPQGARRRFEVTEDLLRIPGVNYDLYARLSRLVTADIRSSGGVNPMAAPPEVLAVLASGNLQLAGQIARQRGTGQPGVDISGLDSSMLSTGRVRRFRLTARVPLPEGGAVRVARFVDLAPRAQDGMPWTTFHIQREVEPIEHRPTS